MNDTTTATYTRAQVTTAFGTMLGQLNEVTETSPADQLTTGTWARLGSGPFTYDEVMAALNNVANDLDEAARYENSGTIWRQDVRNLAVSTALHLLEHPGATLAEAIAAQYADLDDLSYTVLDALPEDADEPVRGTPEHDAAIVATVLEWVS